MFIRILVSVFILSVAQLSFASNKMILRLGSAPHNFYEQINQYDNSYDDFTSGRYRDKLARLGIPMSHVWHNYYICDGYINCICENHKEDFQFLVNQKKCGEYARVISSFNSDHFCDNVQMALRKYGASGLNLIITDDRTTKYITNEESYKSLLNLLNIGGELVLTDLDEDYESQYGYVHMAKPKSLKDEAVISANDILDDTIWNLSQKYKISYDNLRNDYRNSLSSNDELSKLSNAEKKDLKAKKLAVQRAFNESRRTIVDDIFNPKQFPNGTRYTENLFGKDFEITFRTNAYLCFFKNKLAKYLYSLGNPGKLSDHRFVVLTRLS
ncbi:hypothetical protein FACS1894113_5490 [Alphaproteobacteria bacterium]|nr:hypothetical protein FACS1894113_5490 [Alphaproteobacteria bacterium]